MGVKGVGSVELDLGNFPWRLKAQCGGEQRLDVKGHGGGF